MPSRIGKQPIKLNDNTKINIKVNKVLVNGPKGEISVILNRDIEVKEQDNLLIVTAKKETPQAKAMHGLIRKLLFNAVHGVSEGWEKKLEVIGVGFRASIKDDNLELNLGLSHPVIVKHKEGITFAVNKNIITVSGFDKQAVGNTAAYIRSLKKPEPYKGKGIKYSDEQIKRKAGKAAKAVGSA